MTVTPPVHDVPVRTVQVRNGSGFVDVLVDDEDYEYVSGLRWHIADGYPRRHEDIAGRRVPTYLHRHIALRAGKIDAIVDGAGRHCLASVDHINGNKLDNRRSNLALKSRSEQQRNENDRLRRNNRSGYRGVSFNKRRQKWNAYMSKNGRQVSVGYFDTPEEAAEARAASL